MSDLKELNIHNFAGGAATELFARELAEVLKNIDDPNTKQDFQREINLKFCIKPDANKETGMLSVECKSKIAPARHASGQTFFGRRGGKLAAYSQNVNQMELNLDNNLEVIDAKENFEC